MIGIMVHQIRCHGIEMHEYDLPEFAFFAFIAGITWPLTWTIFLFIIVIPTFVKFLAGV
jgi:hypothetical protein